MIEHKVKMTEDCDFTLITVYEAFRQFDMNFDFFPEVLKVSKVYENVARDIKIPQVPLNKEGAIVIKGVEDLGVKFEVDEDLPKYSWQIEGIKDNEKYILYSNGA